MAAEGLGEEGLQAHRLDPLLHRRIAEGVDILRGGALGRILDQALLEDQGMRRVDDDQPGDPVGMAQRRQPGDRAAPIVADQGEALEVRARRRARSDPRRSGRSCRPRRPPACPSRRSRAGRARRRNIAGQRGRDRAPGAVRFGKAVEQDDRLAASRPAVLDVERDAGGQGDAGGAQNRSWIAHRLGRPRGAG